MRLKKGERVTVVVPLPPALPSSARVVMRTFTITADISEVEPHPQAPQVPSDRKTVLYDAHQRPLARRIGFRP